MIFYDIVFILFSLLYVPFSICKKGIRSFNVKERLGFISKDLIVSLRSPDNIWIHAVSVGEVMVLGPFIEKIKKDLPRLKIVLTTTTNTGYYVAKKNFSQSAVVLYSPFDLSFAVRKFFALIRPKVLVIVETEIWPNLMRAAKKAAAPVVIINGRISLRSFKKYSLARPFLKSTLKKIDLFCMQSEGDAERMVAIGADKEKIKVTGNMKFDIDISMSNKQPVSRQHLGLAENDILIVAGSTHKGEEEILLQVYRDLSKEFKNLKLLIAPRHVNRAPQIKKLIGSMQGVFLLDTIGHLKEFYSISDIVFIGGSLVPHGGQNPIEPAYFSRPVIFGPHMFNFSHIASVLLKEKAAMQVRDEESLKAAVISLIKDPKKARAMGVFAKKAVEENKGVSSRNLDLIKNFMRY